MEKERVKLEQPEALGIYLFSKRIFEYLHKDQGKEQLTLIYLMIDLLKRSTYLRLIYLMMY